MSGKEGERKKRGEEDSLDHLLFVDAVNGEDHDDDDDDTLMVILNPNDQRRDDDEATFDHLRDHHTSIQSFSPIPSQLILSLVFGETWHEEHVLP